MINNMLISEEEWFNRLVVEERYKVININWADGFTRIIDTHNGKIYDVKAVKIKSRTGLKMMLKLKEV